MDHLGIGAAAGHADRQPSHDEPGIIDRPWRADREAMGSPRPSAYLHGYRPGTGGVVAVVAVFGLEHCPFAPVAQRPADGSQWRKSWSVARPQDRSTASERDMVDRPYHDWDVVTGVTVVVWVDVFVVSEPLA